MEIRIGNNYFKGRAVSFRGCRWSQQNAGALCDSYFRGSFIKCYPSREGVQTWCNMSWVILRDFPTIMTPVFRKILAVVYLRSTIFQKAFVKSLHIQWLMCNIENYTIGWDSLFLGSDVHTRSIWRVSRLQIPFLISWKWFHWMKSTGFFFVFFLGGARNQFHHNFWQTPSNLRPEPNPGDSTWPFWYGCDLLRG